VTWIPSPPPRLILRFKITALAYVPAVFAMMTIASCSFHRSRCRRPRRHACRNSFAFALFSIPSPVPRDGGRRSNRLVWPAPLDDSCRRSLAAASVLASRSHSWRRSTAPCSGPARLRRAVRRAAVRDHGRSQDGARIRACRSPPLCTDGVRRRPAARRAVCRRRRLARGPAHPMPRSWRWVAQQSPPPMPASARPACRRKAALAVEGID